MSCFDLTHAPVATADFVLSSEILVQFIHLRNGEFRTTLISVQPLAAAPDFLVSDGLSFLYVFDGLFLITSSESNRT